MPRVKRAEMLTENILTRIEPSTRKRLEALRKAMERRSRIRLSVAAVVRLAIVEGLDVLEARERDA